MTEITDRELLIRIDERLKGLEADFRDFKKEMNNGYVQKTELFGVCDRLDRLEKFYWFIIATGLSGLAMGLFNLIFK